MQERADTAPAASTNSLLAGAGGGGPGRRVLWGGPLARAGAGPPAWSQGSDAGGAEAGRPGGVGRGRAAQRPSLRTVPFTATRPRTQDRLPPPQRRSGAQSLLPLSARLVVAEGRARRLFRPSPGCTITPAAGPSRRPRRPGVRAIPKAGERPQAKLPAPLTPGRRAHAASRRGPRRLAPIRKGCGPSSSLTRRSPGPPLAVSAPTRRFACAAGKVRRCSARPGFCRRTTAILAEPARPVASASMSVSMRLRNSGQVHRTVPHRQQDTTASVPIQSFTSTSPAPHARHRSFGRRSGCHCHAGSTRASDPATP